MTKYALVFPGQGSQSRGMMNAYADFPVVHETFAEASDILKQDLWKLVKFQIGFADNPAIQREKAQPLQL